MRLIPIQTWVFVYAWILSVLWHSKQTTATRTFRITTLDSYTVHSSTTCFELFSGWFTELYAHRGARRRIILYPRHGMGPWCFPTFTLCSHVVFCTRLVVLGPGAPRLGARAWRGARRRIMLYPRHGMGPCCFTTFTLFSHVVFFAQG